MGNKAIITKEEWADGEIDIVCKNILKDKLSKDEEKNNLIDVFIKSGEIYKSLLMGQIPDKSIIKNFSVLDIDRILTIVRRLNNNHILSPITAKDDFIISENISNTDNAKDKIPTSYYCKRKPSLIQVINHTYDSDDVIIYDKDYSNVDIRAYGPDSNIKTIDKKIFHNPSMRSMYHLLFPIEFPYMPKESLSMIIKALDKNGNILDLSEDVVMINKAVKVYCPTRFVVESSGSKYISQTPKLFRFKKTKFSLYTGSNYSDFIEELPYSQSDYLKTIKERMESNSNK